ncbi:MAG: hypothetical protein J1E95_10430 [Muribaculaceae bacterium]|nr:hypothetical protein [Muribaculaceae bacterium]
MVQLGDLSGEQGGDPGNYEVCQKAIQHSGSGRDRTETGNRPGSEIYRYQYCMASGFSPGIPGQEGQPL